MKHLRLGKFSVVIYMETNSAATEKVQHIFNGQNLALQTYRNDNVIRQSGL